MEKQEKQGKSERQRVQFDFTPEQLAQIDEVMDATGATTRAEVVRNAMKFYAYFVRLGSDSVVSVDDAEGKNLLRVPISMIV